MALEAVRLSSDVCVPYLDKVTQYVDRLRVSSLLLQCNQDVDYGNETLRLGVDMPAETAKFMVIGHRGSGTNRLLRSDGVGDDRFRENSIPSFNDAARFSVDYVEFDVQVTNDKCPVIFHDIFILSKEQDAIIEKRVTDLTLEEFTSYGLQRKRTAGSGTALLRRRKDGDIVEWRIVNDAPLCTLREALDQVDGSVGFNVELKFDDNIVYDHEDLDRTLRVIMEVICGHAKDRPILFSSFQPDAALLMRRMQRVYPVFFLTNGGSVICKDVRRNSLDEAIQLCLLGGLQGIVSEVEAVLRNPIAAAKIIDDPRLGLVTYGELNNDPEVVFIQYLMGVEGVILDSVQEITAAVSRFLSTSPDGKYGRVV